MSLIAIMGWALFGLSALSLAALALRTSGLKASLAKSETYRKQLEQDFRDAAREVTDREMRLRNTATNLRTDLHQARAELDRLYERVPGEAPIRIDSAIKRASEILARLGPR